VAPELTYLTSDDFHYRIGHMVSTAKFLNTKPHVDYMTKNYSHIN